MERDIEDAAEAACAVLAPLADYRVLRRVHTPASYGDIAVDRQRGLIVDCEATSPFPETAKLLQIGLVPFMFDKEGRVGHLGTSYTDYEDPGEPIDPEITEITGITDAMVAGQRIDRDIVARAANCADLVIAHNACFDRPVIERTFRVGSSPVLPAPFEDRLWACSRQDIPWQAFGIRGAQLGYLLSVHGWFHDAHSALDDAQATLHLLAQPVVSDDFLDVGRPNLSYLLDSLAKPMYKIAAIDAPFPKKDMLSQRGYHWRDRKDGTPKYWWRYVADLEAEQKWLKAKVYRGVAFAAKIKEVTRVDMFSIRA